MNLFSIDIRKVALFGGSGATGGVLGAIAGEFLVPGSEFIYLLLYTSMWTASISLGVALSLIAAQRYYLARTLPRFREILFGAGGGIAAGLIAGLSAQFFFTVATSRIDGEGLGLRTLVALESTRVVAWAMFGGLVGGGLAFCIPNLRLIRGIVGGVVGAAVGALGFIILSYTVGDFLGRWLGAGVLGGCLGGMVACIESALREAWLELEYGPNEKRSVTLGKRPVILGSDRERCTVLVRNAPAVAFKYTLENGQIQFDDCVAGRTTPIFAGDRRSLGTVAVIVRTNSGHPTAKPADRAVMPGPIKEATGFSSTSFASTSQPTGFFLQANGRFFPLIEDSRFTAEQLGLHQDAPPGAFCAEVVRHPSDPNVFGLRNLTNSVWNATLASGETRTADPGKSVKLAKGTCVTTGKTLLRIE